MLVKDTAANAVAARTMVRMKVSSADDASTDGIVAASCLMWCVQAG
jgi:hypothetical protein